MTTRNTRSWPRQRLQIRSIVSVTLPVGWVWVATTALVPYFLIGHGAGSSAETMLGASRATWMSLHVWSSIAMGLLTIGHVILNRRGVSRSVRIAAGIPSRGGLPNRAEFGTQARGYGWVGAVVLIAVVTLGGFAFAAVDDTHSDGRGRSSSIAQLDDGNQVGVGGGHRGNGRR